MIRVGDFAAVAGFVPNRLIRKAITTAVSLAQGHEVPSRVEFAVEVPWRPVNAKRTPRT